MFQGTTKTQVLWHSLKQHSLRSIVFMSILIYSGILILKKYIFISVKITKLCLELNTEFALTILAQLNARCILKNLIRNCLKHQTDNEILWEKWQSHQQRNLLREKHILKSEKLMMLNTYQNICTFTVSNELTTLLIFLTS